MKLTESQLRRIIRNETKAVLRESARLHKHNLADLIFEEEEKAEAKPAGKFAPLDAKTNIKNVSAEEVYNQLVSKDATAPIFSAMANAKPRGYNVDPVKGAEWAEAMGKDEFVSRIKAIQEKIPAKGLPKDQMPVLPGPSDVKGTVDQLEDILTPGGEYNVDFESKQVKGPALSEAIAYNRWGKLAGIISEKVAPPAPNALGGGDEASEKYLKSGLDDGNEKDDVINFKAPGGVAAQNAIPTQTNILIGKTLGMAIPANAGGGGVEGGNLGAYGGIDGEILDGHHRWAATMISNPSANIQTVMDIDLAAAGGGNKIAGLKQLTAIGNALGNPVKTQ